MAERSKLVRWVGGPHDGLVVQVPEALDHFVVQDRGAVSSVQWEHYPTAPVPTRNCPIVRDRRRPGEYLALWDGFKEDSENEPARVIEARRRIPALRGLVEQREREKLLAVCLKELGYYPEWIRFVSAVSQDVEIVLRLIPLDPDSEAVQGPPGAADGHSRG